MHHAAADGGDDGHVVADGDAAAAIDQGFDLLEDIGPMGLQGGAVHHDAHAVDAGGHMFKGHSVVFEHLQHLAAETDFAVHHALFNGDNAVSLMAGDTGDGGNRNLVGSILADHGAGMVRLVGITDIGGDAGFVYREHRVLMQDGGTHVAQFPQFLIGDGGNFRRVFYDPGIRHQETGNVGPVFIYVGIHRTGHQGAGDIAAAAGEGAYFTVCLGTVETRHNSRFAVRKEGRELFLGLLIVQGAVIVEENAVNGIHETPSQVVSHQDTAEVFTAAGAPVLALAGGDSLLHFIQFGVNIHFQVQSAGDGQIAIPDTGKRLRDRFAFAGKVIALIQQISDFIVFLEAFAGSAGDQVATGGFQLQNAANLAELFIIGQRAAAEFCHDTFKHRATSKGIRNDKSGIQYSWL